MFGGWDLVVVARGVCERRDLRDERERGVWNRRLLGGELSLHRSAISDVQRVADRMGRRSDVRDRCSMHFVGMHGTRVRPR